jgi:hypothetical protein
MSSPQFQSGEIGNVNATTVAVTFDQAVTLADQPDPEEKVLTVAKYGEYLVPQGGLARPKK